MLWQAFGISGDEARRLPEAQYQSRVQAAIRIMELQANLTAAAVWGAIGGGS